MLNTDYRMYETLISPSLIKRNIPRIQYLFVLLPSAIVILSLNFDICHLSVNLIRDHFIFIYTHTHIHTARQAAYIHLRLQQAW